MREIQHVTIPKLSGILFYGLQWGMIPRRSMIKTDTMLDLACISWCVHLGQHHLICPSQLIVLFLKQGFLLDRYVIRLCRLEKPLFQLTFLLIQCFNLDRSGFNSFQQHSKNDGAYSCVSFIVFHRWALSFSFRSSSFCMTFIFETTFCLSSSTMMTHF